MSRPDVCFVVLDSLRRDRTSVYGNRATTPELARFAERATVYEQAYTPAPWTLPSHCSMFTGQFPTEHGVTNGFTEEGVGLGPDTETVTERLAARGYRTAGFSNNPWVGRLSGLDRGFEEFVEWNLSIGRSAEAGLHRRRDRLYSRLSGLLGHAARQPAFLLKRPFFTSNLVDRAVRWTRQTSEPSFTFCNLMEAHSPYFPPDRAFRATESEPPGPIEPRALNTKLLGYTMGRLALDGELRERALAYYDAAAWYQDEQLGRLFDALRATGAFDETLVIVCADHGKTLGEYDRSGTPPHYLRRLNTRVPLLVKYPGQQESRRVNEPVELTRLFDVIDDGVRLAETSEGTALTEEFLPHSGRERTAVTRWRSLSAGPHTLLRREDGAAWLVTDDEATRLSELADDERAAGQRLTERLDERVTSLRPAEEHGAADEASLESDVESQLEDLGYLE